ncbi:hypothetical protein [Haliangium sp.]|uniref:hypothetical protein n=1 Tax=Haliangium sp. TaxID=2663208 RepID=UPI003D0BBD46
MNLDQILDLERLRRVWRSSTSTPAEPAGAAGPAEVTATPAGPVALSPRAHLEALAAAVTASFAIGSEPQRVLAVMLDELRTLVPAEASEHTEVAPADDDGAVAPGAAQGAAPADDTGPAAPEAAPAAAVELAAALDRFEDLLDGFGFAHGWPGPRIETE